MITKKQPFRRYRAAAVAGMLLAAGLQLGLPQGAWAKIEPEESRAFYESALEHMKDGDLRAAVIELKNSLQRNPDNAEARLLLGDVYGKLGDGGAAEKELRVAERLGIDKARLAVPLGRALLLQGRFDDVLKELPAAGYAPPTDVEVLLLRAEAQAGLGKWDQALKDYDNAGAKAPSDARVPMGKGRIALAQGQFAEAETQATAALALQAGLVEALLLQAEARRLDGRPEAALAPFQSVTAQPGVAPAVKLRAHLGLASALIALNRDAEAERDVKAALAVAPQVPLAAYLQALLQVRRQDFAAARKTLDAAEPALTDFPPAQFLFGAVYYQAGELETARSWLTRHLRAQPQNLPARKLLAASLLRLKATDEALEVLQPVRQQAEGDPQLLMLLGNAYLAKGRTAEASSMLQKAAELAPQDPRVLSQLAISQMASGKRDDALTTLNTTFDLGADTSALGYALAFAHLQAGDFEKAQQVAQDLRQRFPKSPIAANLEGGAYAAQGKLEEARAAFEAALAIDPGFNEARANLAALKAQAGDKAAAEADYQQVLSADPGNTPAMMGMAGLAQERGDTAATRQWLERAVQVAPDNLKASFALAEFHARQGDAAAGLKLLEGLAARQPGNPQVLLALGRLQMHSGKVDDAVRSYRRLTEATKGSTGSRLLLAEAQLAAGSLQDATASYEDLKKVAGDNPVVWNNLAWLYQQAGDSRAVEHGEQALKLAPGQPAIMDTLGWILVDAGDLQRAKDLLRQAHEGAPEADDIAYHYAAALYKSGDSDSARRLLEATLKSGRPFASRGDAQSLLKLLGS